MITGGWNFVRRFQVLLTGVAIVCRFMGSHVVFSLCRTEINQFAMSMTQSTLHAYVCCSGCVRFLVSIIRFQRGSQIGRAGLSVEGLPTVDTTESKASRL